MRLLHTLILYDVAMVPHSFELFFTATLTPTLASALRMAAAVAGLTIMSIGLVALYRWGRDDHRASTLRSFVIPVAVTIIGAIFAAVGVTLAFAPSSSVPAVDRLGDSSGPSRTVTAPSMAPSDSAGSETSTRSTQRADADPPAERRKGPVVLTDGYAVDFDSRDADWNITQAKYIHFEENLDLRLFTLLNVHVRIVKVAPSAGYFDCANSAGHQIEIAHDRFSEGDAFCVETDQGRWALVVITAKETDGSYSTRVRMNVVVWEKHGM